MSLLFRPGVVTTMLRVGFLLIAPTAQAQVELISRTTSGAQASQASQAVVSATGRFVLFLSARNMTDPTDRDCEVWYLRDRQLGTTELVTRRPDGTPANCDVGFTGSERLTTSADVSADGRFVFFDYAATNLVMGVTTRPLIRAYLLDRVQNTIRVVGPGLNVPAIAASMSANGQRALLFAAPAGPGTGALYLADLVGGQVTAIPTRGTVSDQYEISDDGSRVVYHGRAPSMPTDARPQIYVYDIATNQHILASAADDGRALDAPMGTAIVFRPSISADGSVVAFESNASNQFPQLGTKIVARLLDQQRSVLVSRDNAGNPAIPFLFQDSPSISGDGSRIAFRSNAANLPGSQDGLPYFPQVYVFDLATSRVTLVSQTPAGRGARLGSSINDCEGPGLPPPCNFGISLSPSISADGRFVAFHSAGDDLIANDANGTGYDVYIRDLGSTSTGLPVPRVVRTASTGAMVVLALGVMLLAIGAQNKRRLDAARRP